jgi:hypothetical protein
MESGPKPGVNESGSDIERSGQRIEPADEGIVAEAAATVVHESHDFPSGGGQDLPDGVRSVAVEPSDRGSTGRGSSDAGKTDGDGIPGGGMAGSAGG